MLHQLTFGKARMNERIDQARRTSEARRPAMDWLPGSRYPSDVVSAATVGVGRVR